MSHVRRASVVGADAETCFDYIADPLLAPLFLSSLYAITPIDVEPKGLGNTWGWEYDLFGVSLKGESECVAYERPTRYVWKATSGVETTWTYLFEAVSKGTAVTLDVEYHLADNMLGKLGDLSIVERMNEHEADAAVRNLSTILEGS
jgi:hypothetical protein